MSILEVAAGETGIRAAIARSLASAAPAIEHLAREIHANPEVSHEEFHAARALASYLEAEGFTVERGVGNLPTAFLGEIGSGGFTVGVCAEYDALADVGHACGHHLIAGAAIGAGVALKDVADDLGIHVRVIGTPAEEHGGGKVDLLHSGVFDDVDIAMMVHMVPEGGSANPIGTSSQLVGRFRATFTGRESHAATAPHFGVNAGDAAVIAHVALGMLRQQLPPDHRLSAITMKGGLVTNVIPAHAVVDFECRAWTRREYEVLLERVRNCFRSGALATGATLQVESIEHLLEALRHDDGLCHHWSRAIGPLGYDVTPGTGGIGAGSTDMGNVSQYVPSIHPFIGIPGASASIHTPDFAAGANTKAAYQVMRDAALALAWTAASVADSPSDRERYASARRLRPPYRSRHASQRSEE